MARAHLKSNPSILSLTTGGREASPPNIEAKYANMLDNTTYLQSADSEELFLDAPCSE